MKQVKPNKAHYNKYISRINGAWVMDTNELLVKVTKETISRVYQSDTFEQCYPTELALSYGLEKGLIRLEKSDNGYFSVYFTEKGLIESESAKKTICAFTGRRVVGI